MRGGVRSSVVLVAGLLAALTGPALGGIAPAGAADTASISGTLTNTGGDVYVVMAIPDAWGNPPSAQGVTDSAGHYTVSGLAAGSYVIFFEDSQAVCPSEWYDNQFDPSTANLVSVGANEAISGINADLGCGIDATPPVVNLAAPSGGAVYTLHQGVSADYSCADEYGGSGLASCAGTVPNGSAIDTSTAGSHTFTVTGTDFAANTRVVTVSYTVLAGDVSQTVAGGGFVTTDPGGLGATPEVPIQTQIVVPSGVSGLIGVASHPAGGSPPSGFSFFAQQVALSGPAATPADPYVVMFTVDSSLLGAVLPADVQVFRNGVPVADCTNLAQPAAVPDPCVVGRAAGSGGDAVITVRTSAFSEWNLGRLKYDFTGFFGPVNDFPYLNSVKAGSAVPVKFALGPDHGLAVFAPGFPKSQSIVCSSTAPVNGVESTVTAGSSGLSYDASTGRYSYVWKTDKSWTAGSCRQLVLQFRDGTIERANFKFTK